MIDWNLFKQQFIKEKDYTEFEIIFKNMKKNNWIDFLLDFFFEY